MRKSTGLFILPVCETSWSAVTIIFYYNCHKLFLNDQLIHTSRDCTKYIQPPEIMTFLLISVRFFSHHPLCDHGNCQGLTYHLNEGRFQHLLCARHFFIQIVDKTGGRHTHTNKVIHTWKYYKNIKVVFLMTFLF